MNVKNTTEFTAKQWGLITGFPNWSASQALLFSYPLIPFFIMPSAGILHLTFSNWTCDFRLNSCQVFRYHLVLILILNKIFGNGKHDPMLVRAWILSFSVVSVRAVFISSKMPRICSVYIHLLLSFWESFSWSSSFWILSLSLKMYSPALLLVLAPLAALAQQAEWGQCTWYLDPLTAVANRNLGGGIGWTGATTCVSGTTCNVLKYVSLTISWTTESCWPNNSSCELRW